MSIDPNNFLMGSGAKAVKFPDKAYGTTVTGRIVEKPEVKQQTDIKDGSLKYFSNGDPMMQLVVVAETDQRDPENPDDDGIRAFYVKAKMLEAVRGAVKASGATGLEVGGVLSVTYTADGQPSQRGFNAPKFYTATYKPPTGNAAADAFLSGGRADEPAPAPAPANGAPPAGIDLSALDPATRALVEQQMSQGGSPIPF